MPSAPPPSDPAGSTAAPRPPLWTRPFILVSATYLFVAMIFYTLMTAMALYAVTSFGASDAEAGVVVGAFVLGAVLTRMTTTPATFAWGRRRVLLVALACYVLTTAAYLWADSLAALTAVRLLNGMCFGAAGTVLATAVQRIVPPVRRSEGTGWFSTSMTLAGAVGPMVALQLSTTLGYDALFWACIGFTGMALLIALFLRVPEPPLTGRFRLHRADVFSAEVAPAAGVALASGFMYGGILAFMATFAQQQGYPAMVPSLFFLLFAAGTIVGRAVLGVLHDRHGDNAVVYPILAGMAVSYAVLALWREPAGMLVAGALLGLTYGPVVSVFQTIAIKVVRPTEIGVATGTFFLLLDLGTGLGPMVLGAVVAAVGIPVMYLLTGADVTLPVHVLHGREDGPTVWVSAAIHGDEVAGVEIVRRVLERLQPTHLRGTLLAVPIVNVLGVMAGDRYLPDRRDLNRSFPGSARGSLAARIAHAAQSGAPSTTWMEWMHCVFCYHAARAWHAALA